MADDDNDGVSPRGDADEVVVEPQTPLSPNGANSVPNSPPDSARGLAPQHQQQHDGGDGGDGVEGMAHNNNNDGDAHGLLAVMDDEGGAPEAAAVEVEVEQNDGGQQAAPAAAAAAADADANSDAAIAAVAAANGNTRAGEPSPPESPAVVVSPATQAAMAHIRQQSISRAEANATTPGERLIAEVLGQGRVKDENGSNNGGNDNDNKGSRPASRAQQLQPQPGGSGSRPQSVAGVRPTSAAHSRTSSRAGAAAAPPAHSRTSSRANGAGVAAADNNNGGSRAASRAGDRPQSVAQGRATPSQGHAPIAATASDAAIEALNAPVADQQPEAIPNDDNNNNAAAEPVAEPIADPQQQQQQQAHDGDGDGDDNVPAAQQRGLPSEHDDDDDDIIDPHHLASGDVQRHRSISPRPGGTSLAELAASTGARRAGGHRSSSTTTPPPVMKTDITGFHVGLTDEEIDADQLQHDDEDDDFDAIIMPQIDDDGFKDKIADLRAEVDIPVSVMEEDFDRAMGDQIVVLDAIDLKDISEQEHTMEKERLQALHIAEERWRRRLAEMDARQKDTELNLAKHHRATLEGLKHRKTHEASRHKNQLKWQTQAFTDVAEKLLKSLEDQEKQVSNQYGSLVEHTPVYPDGANRSRRIESQRANEPRLLRLRVDWLRCVKNKLPYGNYVVMVTLFDRLGGHPMRWCKLDDGKGYCHFATTSTTKPAAHGGKWNNTELSFGSEGNDMILVCPSKMMTRPQMCLVFEVFAVRGGRNVCDHVVAWGAFPLCYSNFDIITGRYKLPLLRKELDLRVDKYEVIERKIAGDIDSWLSNLYFEAELVPLDIEYGWCGLKRIAYHYNPNFVDDPNRKRLDWDDKFVREDKRQIAKGNFRPKKATKFGRLGLGAREDDDRENPEVAAKAAAERKKAREQATLRSDYKFSVTNVESDVPGNKKTEKIRFFVSELASDMGYSRFATLEFWITIFLLALVFWFRLYLHYLGEWLLLVKMADKVVYQFDVSAFTVTIGYAEAEAGVVVQAFVSVFGHIFNILIYIGMVLVTFALQRTVEGVPETGYRLVMCWGIGITLDPLLVLLVDCINHNFTSGDSFKLYRYFLDNDGDGAAGAILTIVMTTILVSSAAIIFYLYILHIHMNGRMLDVYDRLHGDEGAFFIPEDREISLTTLRFIVAKSKLKRTHGTQRKFLSESYTIEDHLDPNYKDTRVHITLWNVTPPNPPTKPDESRELFREFIRTDDGAIIEIFDDVDSLGAVDYKKMEEKKYFDRHHSVEAKEKEIHERLNHDNDAEAKDRAEREKKAMNQKWGTGDKDTTTSGADGLTSTMGLGSTMGLQSIGLAAAIKKSGSDTSSLSFVSTTTNPSDVQSNGRELTHVSITGAPTSAPANNGLATGGLASIVEISSPLMTSATLSDVHMRGGSRRQASLDRDRGDGEEGLDRDIITVHHDAKRAIVEEDEEEETKTVTITGAPATSAPASSASSSSVGEGEENDDDTDTKQTEEERHAALFGVQEEEEEEDPRARGHQATGSGVAAGHMGLKSTVMAGGLTGGLRSVEDTNSAPRSPRADDDENDTNTEGDD